MTYTPQHRINSGDRTDFLGMAAEIVDLSGVVDILTPPTAAQTTLALAGQHPSIGNRGRGRPAFRPQLPARALLIVMFEILWSGMVLSWAGVTARLWFHYTPDELERIGLPRDWRDEQLAADMRLRGTDTPSTREERLHAAHLWHREVKRITRIAERTFAPVDDTVLPANKSYSRREIEVAIAAQPELAPITAAKNHAMNRLVIAALIYFNKKAHPHLDDVTDLHAGILRDHKYDLGLDEHGYAVAQLKGTRRLTGKKKDMYEEPAYSDTHTAPQPAPIEEGEDLTDQGYEEQVLTKKYSDRKTSAKQDAGGGKTRRLKFAEGIGITAVQAIARAFDRRVPNVILGIGLNPLSAASVPGSLTALDAVDANTTRQAPTGKTRQYVVVDMGYTKANDMNARLIDRGYSIHGEYPSDWNTTHDLAPATEFGNEQVTGPYLYNGNVVCPAARQLVRKHKNFGQPDVATMNVQQLIQHTKTSDLLEAHTMSTDGRIEKATKRGRGRPKKGEKPLIDNYRLPVICPAVDGKLRCPIIIESLAADPSVPMAADPPLDGARPACCNQTRSPVHLDAEQIKVWQEHMVGTWQHHDLLSLARTRTEFPFSQLTRRGGGNLYFGSIQFHKRGPVAIAIGLAVAAANIHIMQQWDSTLDTHEGAPRETGAVNRRLREGLMKEALTM